MSTFKNIQGRNIRSYTTNPDNPLEGQMWYNQTEQKLKGVAASGATRSGSSMLTARSNAASFGNTRDASAAAAGYTGTANTNVTEEFNGSGFSSGGNVNTSRRGARGTGAITAGLICSGYSSTESNATEEYDGSSFTNGGNLNTARFFAGTFGTQTAGVAAGGNQPSPAKNVTEEYNGSAWTTVPATLSTGRENHMAGGTETAGIVCGGDNATPTILAATEEYDGSTWTAGGNLNTARAAIQGSGIQTAAIVIGGNNPTKLTSIETYNGTSWTTSPATLATARDGAHNAGTTTAAIVSGGVTPGPTTSNTTEEFNFTANTITAAAFASGGNLNTAREMGGVAGTTPAGIYMAGKTYPNTFRNETEEYNGSSWSEQSNVSTARTAAGAGTQTAGLIFGGTNGAPGSTGVQSATEEYDGSSWTNGGSLSAARLNMYGAGLQTAAFGAGGVISTNAAVTTVEDYNGSTWTSGTAMPTAQQGGGTAGLPSARLVFGGYSPYSAVTLEGDGEGWTASGSMIQARGILAGFGSQTDAIAAGGSVNPNANSALAEGYDGTSWSTRPSMATARMSFSPSGSYNTTTGGFVAGGSQQGNPQNAQTEEWNAETTTVNIKNISSS